MFRQSVINRIKKVTGKEISLEEFLLMDPSEIRRLLGITAKPPIKIRRGDPEPLYEVVSEEYKRRRRALVNGIIKKYEKSIKGI